MYLAAILALALSQSGCVGLTSADASKATSSDPAPVAASIKTQPASRTVTDGQTATFSVAATGTAPLGYQWKKNGAAISGATSSAYTTPATTASDNGAQFTVSVSNSAGSVTSNAATLTVNAASGQLTLNPSSLNFGNVNLGSSNSLTVTLSNSSTANITISNVSVAGPGFNASGVPAGLILTPSSTATLKVTFSPAATGSVTGSVTISSDATNPKATITLSGSGTQSVAHSVTLSWTSSTSTVIGYNVYRSTSSAGPYAKLNASVDGSTTFTDSTVDAAQTYYYAVTSVDSANVESGYSTPVSATVPSS
jgi:Cep192 domain 4/Immunoglobulin domain